MVLKKLSPFTPFDNTKANVKDIGSWIHNDAATSINEFLTARENIYPQ